MVEYLIYIIMKYKLERIMFKEKMLHTKKIGSSLRAHTKTNTLRHYAKKQSQNNNM